MLIAYIVFWFKSLFQKKVQTVAIKNLITHCFRNASKFPEFQRIKSYRNTLLNNSEVLDISDFGAGSRVMKTKQRSVKQLTKNAGTTLKRAKLLYKLVNYINAKHILELGTSTGIATYTMALANKNANITSVEGCPNIANFTKNKLKELAIENVSIKTSNFDTILPILTKNTYDLIFIDGNHQKEATINYFETLLASTHQNSILIFDDIYWSKGMTEAWKTISNHPKVTFSIDTFFWGIVFLNKENKKQHCYINL